MSQIPSSHTRSLWMCLLSSLFGLCWVLGLPLDTYAQLTPNNQSGKPPQRLRPLTKVDKITGLLADMNLGISYNGIGLRLAGQVGYKWRLYKNDNEAFKNNFVSASAITRLTPAWLTFGAAAMIQPASFFNLTVSYRFRYHLPFFFTGIGFRNQQDIDRRFRDPNNPINDHLEGQAALEAQLAEVTRENNGEVFIPLQHMLSVEATLQVKISMVVALWYARYTRTMSTYQASDRYPIFYESNLDILVNKEDHVFSTNGLVGIAWKQFIFLVVTSYTTALEAQIENWYLGPAMQWKISEAWGAFKEPTLTFVVSWYLRHPWRGQEGVPYFASLIQGHF